MKPKVLMNSFRMSESRLARLDYLGVNGIELVFNWSFCRPCTPGWREFCTTADRSLILSGTPSLSPDFRTTNPTLASSTFRALLSQRRCSPLAWGSTSASLSWGPPLRRRGDCSTTRRRAPPCSSASGSPTWGIAGPGPSSTWPRSTPLGAVWRVLFSSTLTGRMPRALLGTSRRKERWRRIYEMYLNILILIWKMSPLILSILGNQYCNTHPMSCWKKHRLCETLKNLSEWKSFSFSWL